MYDTQSGYGVILEQCMFFGMFAIFYHFKVVWSIDVRRNAIVPHAIYEFNGGRVSVFGKEGDGIFAIVDELKLLVHSIVDEKSILDLVHRLLVLFIEHAGDTVVVFRNFLFFNGFFISLGRLHLWNLLHFFDLFELLLFSWDL